MRFQRVGLRGPMAFVAMAAVALGARSWSERWSAHYREIYRHHDRLKWRAMCELSAASPRPTPLSRHHEDLARKYRLAALSPWLPVPADPPAPARGPILLSKGDGR